MSRRKKQRADHSGSDSPLSQNPFAQLAGVREQLPPGDSEPTTSDEAPSDETPSAHAPSDDEAAPPARAVLRYERKGHGGKEVTLVEQLGLAEGELERWLVRLKRELGCGGSRHGESLLLQGDQRRRLPDVLRRLGVQKISSN
ncbi:MAG: translation initiation factor [Myxococcales bacterium]|nr:translation initiation factor [Myxococcales bacterium]